MLVYALIASKMVTLANYVAHGYGDAKSAATELHGRAAYSQRDVSERNSSCRWREDTKTKTMEESSYVL